MQLVEFVLYLNRKLKFYLACLPEWMAGGWRGIRGWQECRTGPAPRPHTTRAMTSGYRVVCMFFSPINKGTEMKLLIKRFLGGGGGGYF